MNIQTHNTTHTHTRARTHTERENCPNRSGFVTEYPSHIQVDSTGAYKCYPVKGRHAGESNFKQFGLVSDLDTQEPCATTGVLA